MATPSIGDPELDALLADADAFLAGGSPAPDPELDALLADADAFLAAPQPVAPSIASEVKDPALGRRIAAAGPPQALQPVVLPRAGEPAPVANAGEMADRALPGRVLRAEDSATVVGRGPGPLETAARLPQRLVQGAASGFVDTASAPVVTIADAASRAIYKRPQDAARLQAGAPGVRQDLIAAGVMAPTTATEWSNPQWWAAQLGQTAGSVAGMAASSAMTGGSVVGATALHGTSESLTEAASVYNELVGRGMAPEEARNRAAGVFASNMAVLGLTDLPQFKAGAGLLMRTLGGAGLEATQEVAQQGISNVATGRDLTEGMPEGAVMGALAGGAFGASRRRAGPPLRAPQEAPPAAANRPFPAAGAPGAEQSVPSAPAAPTTPVEGASVPPMLPPGPPAANNDATAPVDSRRAAIERELGGAVTDADVDALLREADEALARMPEPAAAGQPPRRTETAQPPQATDTPDTSPAPAPADGPRDAPEVVNRKTWYHGTARPGLTADRLGPTATRIDNLFGMGVYLTDSPDIAEGYAQTKSKRRGVATVYEAGVNVDRVLDLEQPAPPEVRAVVERFAQGLDESYGFDVAARIRALGTEGVTTEALWRAMSDAVGEDSPALGVSRDTLTEAFQDLTINLTDLGYDALTHTGGRRTGKPPHQVLVLLDPNDEFGRGRRRGQVSSFTPRLPAWEPGRYELTGEAAAIQDRTIREVESTPDAVLARFDAQQAAAGRSKVLNGDDFSEVFDDYRRDRAGNMQAVRGAATRGVQAGLTRDLAKPPTGSVVFMAGQTGSGKSTAVDVNDPSVEIVFDSTLSELPRARRNVAAAIASGRNVEIRYVYRDPVAAYRAVLERQAKHGRPVPIETAARSGPAARETVLQLAHDYADVPDRVRVAVFENVENQGLVARDIAWLKHEVRYDPPDVLRQKLQAEAPGAAPARDAAVDRRAHGRVESSHDRGVQEEPRRRPGPPRRGEDGTLAEPVAPRRSGPPMRQPSAAAETDTSSPPPIPRRAGPPRRNHAVSRDQARAHAPELWGDAALPASSDTDGSPTRRAYTEAPTPPPGVTAPRKPMSESSVVTQLARIFGHERPQGAVRRALGAKPEKAPIPVGTGRFRQRAYGIYKIQPQVIRLKRFGDLATFTHELGHDIDYRILAGDRPAGGAIDAELLRLGHATSPASATRDYQRHEGVAEFFRLWFANPDTARAEAPRFAAAFADVLANDTAMARQFEEGRILVQSYLAQPLDVRGRARVDFSGRDPQAEAETTLQQLETAMVDDLAALRRTVAALAAGKPIDIGESAYVLARLARGAGAKAHGFLHHGLRDEAGQFAGASFRAAIAPVVGQLEDFSVYLVARRAQELRQRNIEPGMRAGEARAILERYDSPAFRDAAAAVYAFQDGVLDYAVRNGAVTAEQAGQIRALNQNYVPFWRILDNESVPSVAKGLAKQRDPIKRIKGSGRDVVDPLEAIIRNTHAIVGMVEQHRAMVALVKQATSTTGGGQFLELIPTPQVATTFNLSKLRDEIEAAVDGDVAAEDLDRLVTVFTPAMMTRGSDQVISVVHEGKRQFYEVHDKALYEALVMTGPRATGRVIRWLGAPARGLRAGATLTVGFMARNPVRDAWVAMVQSRAGFRPGYDSLRGLFSFLKQDEHYQRFLASGAGQSALVSGDRDVIARELRALKAKGTLREHMQSVVAHPIDMLRALSETSEMMTRLGEFRRAEEKGAGLEEAGLAARDVTVDFARGGTVSKQANQFIAFFNARIQGWARMGETFRDKPAAASIRLAVSVTLPSLILWALNKDDEEYQELPPWEKATYWHIPLRLVGGEGWMRVPKPFEYGALFGTVFERAMDQITERDPHAWKRLFVDDASVDASGVPAATVIGMLRNQMLEIAGPLLPGIEVLANYDTFRGRAIVSPFNTDLPPELQYNRWTSETAKAIGRLTGQSPAMIDHLIMGYGAGLARDTVRLLDEGVKAARGGGPPAPSLTADRIPGLNVFARGYAGGDAASIQELYARLEKLRAVPQTVKAYEAEGSADRAKTFEALYPGHAGERKRLNAAAERLKDMRAEVSRIYSSQTMTPREKRDALDRVDERMVNTAREALGKKRLPSRFGAGPPR